MLQLSLIALTDTKIRALNFGATQPFCSWKVLMETTNFFYFKSSDFFAKLYCIFEASTAKISAEWFSGSLKIIKKLYGKN